MERPQKKRILIEQEVIVAGASENASARNSGVAGKESENSRGSMP
jgi:hypothetical protein